MAQNRLPSVDRVLRDVAMQATLSNWGFKTAKSAVVALQANLRKGDTLPTWATRAGSYAAAVDAWLGEHVGHGYRPVFNLTGTIIHTNLGRSLLDSGLAAEALELATRPATLEYDLAAGGRGQREGIVEHRLRLLTGAEAATVVNNNAAAVLLVLNTLARGKEVPVSRGELIEIGGSFRLPEVMERAGCILVEVGTTNRTHPNDYRRAIGERTGVLLKAHPSNYRIEGFTSEVSVAQIAALGRPSGVPTFVDAGSGALIDLTRFGLKREPLPSDLLAAGADLVSFSGDKLLGGVQAGIVVGRRGLVDQLDRNPLKRALRLDKVALALLNLTLKAYEDERTAVTRIPLLANLAQPMPTLERRGARVRQVLDRLTDGVTAVEAVDAQVGSGALPGERLPSRAVTVSFEQPSRVRSFASTLRGLNPPVIGRIADNKVILDMRGAEPLDQLVATLEHLA